MSWGGLTPEQELQVQENVRGRVVWDLGAGDCTISLQILAWGASRVVAVDVKPAPHGLPQDPRLTYVQTLFRDWGPEESAEVVFLSWPDNRELPGLVELCDRAPRVLYLGRNTDFTTCGFPRLFEHFRSREVEAMVRHPANDLIVYGPRRVTRAPVPEETAALSDFVLPWTP